ncbi:ATP-dependent RNA helicase DHX58-like [Diadema antillarum]|uniref:ATP-dependent RNA helicase DHX58-like n=1 Tax=Diadema antillarum TaxID=105358 RepID=UPI003A8A2948
MEEHKDINILRLTIELRGYIVEYVDPKSILNRMTSLRIQHRKEFSEVHDASSRSRREGMDKLLNVIDGMTDQRGVYKIFVEALRKSGNKYLYDVINNKASFDKDWEIYKLLLATEEDYSKVNPRELMVHLPCLNDTDKEVIGATTNQHGAMYGAFELFSRLEAQPPSTVNQLIRGLKEVKQVHLARELRKAATGLLKGIDIDPSSDDDDGDDDDNDRGSGSSDNGIDGSRQGDSHGANGSGNDESAGVASSIDALLDLSPKGAQGGSSRAVEVPPCSSGVKVAARQPVKEFSLFDYQQELAEPALKGKNTIIVAPTGSGKTRVAVGIAKSVLENNHGASPRPRRVVFVVNKVPLVEQQKSAFQEFITAEEVVGISGNMSAQVPLEELLEQSSVVILTAQILVNGINEGLSLNKIGLLILDECHNTQKGNAYNAVMAEYRKIKREKPEELLPQVVGLTASLGVGKAKRQKVAEEHVLTLCANLDAEEISVVRNCQEQLNARHNKPHEETFSIRGRSHSDPFQCLIAGIMDCIENAIFQSEGGKELVKKRVNMKELSSHQGSQQYEGKISKLIDYINVHLEEKHEPRSLLDCAEFLKIYNQSLYINRDARTLDAVHCVKGYISELKERSKHAENSSTQQKLIALFEAKQGDMQEICDDPQNQNPVLRKLEEILETEYQGENNSTQAILFTNTRASTWALKSWIEETDSLQRCNIRPGVLIGAGREGGMTQSEQDELLKMFRDERHNLVIATSVAEEGLDIQMCNLVIRYNYVRDDIGRVQARGRSRAKGGKFLLIFNNLLPNLEERERMNKIRERMMVKATETVCNMIKNDRKEYDRHIRELQKKDFNMQQLQEASASSQRRQTSSRKSSDMKFLCKCRQFACYTDDIKCINGQHHIATPRNFFDNAQAHDIPKSSLYDDVYVTQTINCKSCGNLWGYTMIYMGLELPLVSIKNFVTENSAGERAHFKKWKDYPFPVKAMTHEELLKRFASQREDDKSTEEDTEEKDPE